MHRLFTTLLPFLLSAVIAGCAAAGHSNALGGGSDDMGMTSEFPDLSGLDLTGVDLSGFPPQGNDMAVSVCDVLAQNCAATQKCTTDTGDMGTCIADGTRTLGQTC